MKKNERIGSLLETLVKLEKEGRLFVRDKFVNLFMLEQIETENKKVLRSIRRKIDRTKKLYPAEMQRLLPPSKTRATLSFKRTMRRELTCLFEGYSVPHTLALIICTAKASIL